MNKHNIVNIRGPLERDAIRLLQDIPGVTVEPTAPNRRQVDVVIRAGEVTHAVEVKAHGLTNAAAARQLVEYARHLPKGTRLLLVARATTADARRLLEEEGIGLMDTQGNMRVQLPGVFLWTEGRLPAATLPGKKLPPVKLTGKAGVAAQALLHEPRRKWQVHDLAKAAAISVGLAHRVIARLEREKLLEVGGAGPGRTRRLGNPTALLDLWAEEMHDRGVKQVAAFRLARDPRAQGLTLSRALAEAGVEHAISGPAGAARLAPFITAIPVTDIWVTDTVSLNKVAAAVHADVVQQGHNIVLRQAPGDAPLAFRTKVDDVWTADRFRLFHDLSQNPRRGREQADQLRKEVIGF